jgi:DNA-binding transcriptional ArsR family regulator
MIETVAALAEPTRLRIIELLCDGEKSAGEIERALAAAQPATSKHLRALREAGLVSVRRDAQRRLYRLNPAPLAELDQWLAPFRHFWAGRLDALQSHLDQES